MYIQTNQNLNYILIFLFSILPISIILGSLIFEINILIIILHFIYYFIIDRNSVEKIFDKKELLVFLIIIGYLVFNTLISIDPFISIRRNLLYFKFFLIVISFRYFLSNNEIIDKVIKFWFSIFLVICFDVFFERYFGHNILGFESPMPNERIVSFFRDELIVGSLIISFLIPIFSYYILKKKISFACISIIFFSLAIFLSGERSNLFKLIVGVTLITLLLNWNYNIKKYFILIILIILGTIYFNESLKFRYFSSIKNRIIVTENKNFKENLIETKYINQGFFAYEISKNKIFFGVGNKNFHLACRKYVDNNYKGLCFTHPHQVYYELLSEHGIIGSIIILFSLYFLIFRNKLKNTNINKHEKNELNIFRIFLILSFIPILPSGSFFSSYISAMFWINYVFYTIYRDKILKKN